MVESDKKKFKEDMRNVEELKYSNPREYREKMVIMDKVKEKLESKIDKINERIAKVKTAEQKIRQ